MSDTWHGYTQEDIKELVRYDPETGELFWKPRTAKWFKNDARWTAEQVCKRWNTLFSHGKALNSKNLKRNYLGGTILSFNEKAHRLIWFYMTGEIPEYIDHKDGNGFNNRWDNLRNVSNQENCKNFKRRYDNKSGQTGVSWNKGYRKWEAYIWHSYKKYGLGYYDDLEEAILARKNAEPRFGYHENHGEDRDFSAEQEAHVND